MLLGFVSGEFARAVTDTETDSSTEWGGWRHRHEWRAGFSGTFHNISGARDCFFLLLWGKRLREWSARWRTERA